MFLVARVKKISHPILHFTTQDLYSAVYSYRPLQIPFSKGIINSTGTVQTFKRGMSVKHLSTATHLVNFFLDQHTTNHFRRIFETSVS